jgi:hypothetical protein
MGYCSHARRRPAIDGCGHMHAISKHARTYIYIHVHGGVFRNHVILNLKYKVFTIWSVTVTVTESRPGQAAAPTIRADRERVPRSNSVHYTSLHKDLLIGSLPFPTVMLSHGQYTSFVASWVLSILMMHSCSQFENHEMAKTGRDPRPPNGLLANCWKMPLRHNIAHLCFHTVLIEAISSRC